MNESHKKAKKKKINQTTESIKVFYMFLLKLVGASFLQKAGVDINFIN